MKHILLTLILFLSFLLSNEISAQKLPSKKILKKTEDGVLYLSSDTTEKAYKSLIPEYPDLREILNTDFRNIQKKACSCPEIKGKWVPLHQVNKQLVLFGPCDWMASYGFILSDSILIKAYSSGPDIYEVLKVSNVSGNIYKLKTLVYNDSVDITIYYDLPSIDQHLSIWKFQSRDYKYYELMVRAEMLKKYPVVICDCGEVKCHIDIEFEKINFKKMLEGYEK